jgi:hypothetical protein
MIKSLFTGIPVIGPIIALVPDFVWQGLAIFLVAWGIYMAGDFHGRGIERAKCQARELAAKQQAQQQDTNASNLTNENDTKVTADLITQDAADKQAQDAVDRAIEKYKADHPATKAAAPCRSTLSRDDVKRLRD